uniref:Uncharacterized protein n=1 Tax=Micrurus surinamensis TaxID=129470 RepID=A0A2D4NLK2_MICSU
MPTFIWSSCKSFALSQCCLDFHISSYNFHPMVITVTIYSSRFLVLSYIDYMITITFHCFESKVNQNRTAVLQLATAITSSTIGNQRYLRGNGLFPHLYLHWFQRLINSCLCFFWRNYSPLCFKNQHPSKTICFLE